MTKGVARKGFDLDLKDGLLAENRLNDTLRGAKIEVKSDKQAWKTGNIFVEDSCNGKPSGISTTEAEFWAYEVRLNTFYLIPICFRQFAIYILFPICLCPTQFCIHFLSD